MHRLETVDPELYAVLRRAPKALQLEIATGVARLAVGHRPCGDPRATAGLAALGTAGRHHAVTAQVTALVEALDEKAWNAQDAVEPGDGALVEYHRLFETARAHAALAYALQADADLAAVEALYEAQAAVGGINPLRDTIQTILTRPSR